jgi:hypothetical protein
MSNLENIQADFQNYITSPSYGDFEKIKHNMLAHTQNHYGLDAASRLDIYYDMYRLRLLDVLFTDYPKLVGIMGEEKFTQAFLHYLLHYPSNHYSVRPFGAKLAEFLSQFKPFCFKKHFSEMAKFEWALSLTYDAADAEALDFEALKKLPPENWAEIKFHLHPSVSLLSLNYNIVEVWKILEAQKIVPEQDDESILEHYPEENPEKFITALPSPETWLIWRQGLSAHFQEINSEQYFLLEAINQDLDFSEICEKLTRIMSEEAVPGFVMQFLNSPLAQTISISNLSLREA